MEEIDVKEAKRLVDEEGVLLIDCREQHEWDEVRIPGAKFAPLSRLEHEPDLVEAAPQVVFYCAAGLRSQAAAEIYEEQYPDSRAYSMAGGISEWILLELPTESGPQDD
jgi:rhodanese-related sulfurtransferase